MPISALKDINIFRTSGKFDWWSHADVAERNCISRITCLEEAINWQEVPQRQSESNLRLPLSGIANVPGHGQINCGHIDMGKLERDSTIKAIPANVVGRVKNIQAHKVDVPIGLPGMNIGFSLLPSDSKNASLISKIVAGNIVGPADDPTFIIHPYYKITGFSFKGSKGHKDTDAKGIKVGYSPVFTIGSANVICKFVKLIVCNKGKDIKIEEPTTIPCDYSYSAIIYTMKPVFGDVSSKENNNPLGKWIARDSNKLVSCGVISGCYSAEEAKNLFGINHEDVAGGKVVTKAKK